MLTDSATTLTDTSLSSAQLEVQQDIASSHKPKRAYQRKTNAQRALEEAHRMLERAIQAEQKARADVQAEEQAELVRRGKSDFVSAVEALDATTREAILAAVIGGIDLEQQTTIQAWISSVED